MTIRVLLFALSKKMEAWDGWNMYVMETLFAENIRISQKMYGFLPVYQCPPRRQPPRYRHQLRRPQDKLIAVIYCLYSSVSSNFSPSRAKLYKRNSSQ